MRATASTNSPKSKTPSPFKSAVPNKQHSTKARMNLVSFWIWKEEEIAKAKFSAVHHMNKADFNERRSGNEKHKSL